MGKVTVEQSISLDGFSTGPDVTNAEPMGVGGEALHEWMYRDVGPRPSGRNEEAEALLRTSGAVIVGRRMFDLGVDPWGDPPPFHMPVFVITHRPRDPLPRTGGTTYYFVTGGLEDALAQARKSAGDKDVSVFGGADLVRQFLGAGLVDEVRIHLAHLLLGAGTRLFDGLDPANFDAVESWVEAGPSVTHLTLKLRRP